MSFVNVSVHRGLSEIHEFLGLADKHGAVICGGYPRYCCSPKPDPVPAGDIDFFPKTQETADLLCRDLEAWGFTRKHENHVSVTYGYDGEDLRWKLKPVPQVIKPVVEGKIVTLGSVEEILSNFDFTVVRVALVKLELCRDCGCGKDAHCEVPACLCDKCKGWEPAPIAWGAIADDQFEEDERNAHLRVKNIHCPISSTLRCMKYSRKGYFIGPMEVLKLFQDWDARGPGYKERMAQLFTESQMGQMTQKQIDELEAMLRVD